MTRKLHVLLIDDDDQFCRDFTLLATDAFQVASVASGQEGLAYLQATEPDAVFLDLHFSTGWDGLQTLQHIREQHRDIPVIMITDHDSVKTAVHAMKLGALHYTSKKPNIKELAMLLERELKNVAWKKLYQEQYRDRYGAMIGDSPAMRDLYAAVSRVAASSATVLIEGEMGSGKELVAHEIHCRSGRADAPFITVNCGAIPDTLFESELFGHEKGSFTGAHARQIGKFELADGGTLFLDEIANLSPVNQGKLLRVLEEHTCTRLGARAAIPVNVRVLAATNQNLLQTCDEGRFRRDLYYRVSTVILRTPPLRDRPTDIPLLVAHFTKSILLGLQRSGPGLSDAAVATLTRYHWPGNVRELRNVIERSLIMAPDRLIEPYDLQLRAPAFKTADPWQDLYDLPYMQARKTALTDFQHCYFTRLLAKHHGNVTQAAHAAGVPRSTLHRALSAETEPAKD